MQVKFPPSHGSRRLSSAICSIAVPFSKCPTLKFLSLTPILVPFAKYHSAGAWVKLLVVQWI